MAPKSLCLLVATALLAYYVYVPLPESLEDRWRVMLIDATIRTLGHLAGLAEWLGVMHYMDVLKLMSVAEYVPPTSDENVTVTETEFVSVPVRLYVPRERPGGLKRGLVYFHGGGWCIGEAGEALGSAYDYLSRQTSNDLNAVVVSVNYRLAPQHHFPAQFEDVYAVTKFFLRRSVLAQYGVDPARVAVAGDSAGGNLAAAVAQQVRGLSS
uniref:Arylacetamide deacetylase n=1 Tax=Nothoprocta perdicaria TaxID=30464 RepID=A0A8C6YJU1_NOTPE